MENNDYISQWKLRFAAHPERHPGVTWEAAAALLQSDPAKLQALVWMEESGGEPDVVLYNQSLQFWDCAAQSPAGRRSLCYDEAALEQRKKNPPAGSAVGQAEAAGVRLLTEEEYFFLQTLGEFDTKTSSWIAAPETLRGQGGALFCERRYGRVFTFHNGADSYYGVRGYRAALPLK